MKALSAICLAIAMVGCGGGGGGAMNAPTIGVPLAPRVVPLKDGDLALVTMYGDSTQRGDVATGMNTATIAQALIPTVAKIHQEGVGGSSAWHLVMGTEVLHTKPFLEVAADSSAHIMFFRFGINDTQVYSAEDFQRQMEHLIVVALAGGARKVVVETPNPVWVLPHKDLLPSRVQVLRDLALKHKVVLCDHYKLAFEQGLEYETFDGVHPNGTAYQFQGKTVANCILQALGKPFLP